MYDSDEQCSPPPYSQELTGDAMPSGHAVLNNADTLSVGRIVVTTVVVYTIHHMDHLTGDANDDGTIP